MASGSRAAVCVCLGLTLTVSSVSSTCGFVTPCVSVFQQGGSGRATARMSSSDETEASTPYAGFPANWRAPLPDDNTPADAQPQGTVGEDEEDEEEEEDTGSAQTLPGGEDPVNSLRTTSVVLEEAKRVSRSSAAESTRRPMRTAQRPPGIESLQTESQRRRALPLSKLKRVKPKRRRVIDSEEGEFRPLVTKTDRESVLRGEDYWIDYRELDAKAARREKRAKAPAPDQFAQSKMKAEIVNPYKQNWILVISVAIAAIAGFIRINPGILDDPSIITFPNEL